MKNLGIINFFAGWCKPCREEVPYLNNLQEKYPDELIILGIDYEHTDKESIKKTADKLGIKFPVLIDKYRTIVRGYKVYGLPTSVLIDPDGFILRTYKGMGDVAKKDLEKNIEEQIKKIVERKKYKTFKIENFLELTGKAREENLGIILKSEIENFLKEFPQVKILSEDNAMYKITGSVSKWTDVLGIEVKIIEENTSKVVSRFSLQVSTGDYKKLLEKLKKEVEIICQEK